MVSFLGEIRKRHWGLRFRFRLYPFCVTVRFIFRAVWHCSKSHQRSWELDPTEGPSRVRKRLQRCHLRIDARFLCEESKEKLSKEQQSTGEKDGAPLSYHSHRSVETATVKAYSLAMNWNSSH